MNTWESESTERDELARELFIADIFNQPREQSVIDWNWFNETPRFTVRVEHYKTQADHLLAAGYRRPRTIDSTSEGSTDHRGGAA